MNYKLLINDIPECVGSGSFGITPEYIRGFVDGEGNFHISVYNKHRMELLFQVSQSGEIGRKLLEEIKAFFNCGKVVCIKKKGSEVFGTNYKTSEDTYSYQVYALKDIWYKVIPFFDKYKLIIKHEQYECWRKAAEIMRRRGHLTHRGRYEIMALKARVSRHAKLGPSHRVEALTEFLGERDG
jgi:intein-encoded DNA endonuclease-like protein